MQDANQSPGDGTPRDAAPDDATPRVDAPVDATPFAPPPHAFEPPPFDPIARAADEKALVTWLALVLLGGVAALALGLAELGALGALAGIFAVSHAADRDARWVPLHQSLAWTVPVGGCVLFASLVMVPFEDPTGGWTRLLAIGFAGLGAVACLATWPTPAAAAVARVLFRVPEPGRTVRLTARLVLMALLFCVPGWYLVARDPDLLLAQDELLGAGSLWGGLIGMTMLAFGGVGFLVRRDLRGTLERLGVVVPRPRDLIVIVLGVAFLFLMNGGAEALQRRWFPELWASDQRVNTMLAGRLSRAEAVLLGVSAGVGEELSMRGGLQPRLGLVLTSLVFAALHVQYSWLGMAVILALGLTLGAVRRRTNTTVAILIHALYDLVAVLTVDPVAA